MRALLKATEQRRLNLIEILLDTTDWMNLPHLAERLNCSVRNLKEDIAYFKQTNPEFGLETSHLGVRILMNQSTGIQEFYRDILTNTLIFQLLEEIFFDETLTIDGLANLLHTSHSTTYRAIESLNAYFAPHQCRIETNPCRFIGDEVYIRNYYRTYFKEKNTVFEWPFRGYDEQAINTSFNRVLKILEKGDEVEDTFLDFAFYESIKLMAIVSVIRYNNGHIVDTTQNKTVLFTIIFNAFIFFVLPKGMKVTHGKKVTSDYIHQVFYPYFNKNSAFGIKSLNKLRRKNELVNEAVAYAEDALSDLAETLNIEIDSSDLMVALYGTVYLEEHDPNGMYILYHRNKMFNRKIHHEFPQIYQALHTITRNFRCLLDRPDDEDKVHYLIYILFTNWEDLLTNLYTNYKKTKVLIISDGHFSHANTIKNLLSFHLSKNVTIDTYKNRSISSEQLRNMDYDLLVSTFKIPAFIHKKTIMVDHYLTPHDIQQIECVLTEIIQAKRTAL